VLEVNLSDPQNWLWCNKWLWEKTLDKTLTPDQLSKLDGILRKAGLSVQQVNSYSLSTVSLMSMKTLCGFKILWNGVYCQS
jgi:uncharacterized protein YbaP (TraB family)